MVKKLPRDLDIFSLFTRMAPACIQVCTNLWPVAHSDWAISFSWCGNSRSGPPPWISKVSPKHLVDMAEHSMCQPGRPSPQGDCQLTSPGLAAFHRAKSAGLRLASCTSTRAPASRSSSFFLLSLPRSEEHTSE